MMRNFLEEKRRERMTTTTTATTTTTPRTTTSSESISKQSDIPIFDSNSIDISKSTRNNNVQQFRRYYLPPEVMISHQLSIPGAGNKDRERMFLEDVEGGPRKAKKKAA